MQHLLAMWFLCVSAMQANHPLMQRLWVDATGMNHHTEPSMAFFLQDPLFASSIPILPHLLGFLCYKNAL